MAKSLKSDRNGPDDRREPVSSIGIETLKTCLDSYTYVKNRGEAVFYTEIARKLSLDLATFTRRISRFEEEIQKHGYAGLKLFCRVATSQPSSGATQRRVQINKDRTVEEVLYNVRQIVEGWDRLVGARGIQHVSITLGMSLSVARFLMPFLTKKFKDYWIDVVQTKAERLHELARKGLCDLVLVEVAGDLARSQKERVFQFDLALMAPRGHWTESKSIDHEFSTGYLENKKEGDDDEETIWKQLANHNDSLCLLTEDPALFPLPDYPGATHLPENLRVLRVGSTTLCNSMVMSSDLSDRSLLTIGVPHFLTEDDLEKIHILPTDTIGSPVHFALLRPGRPTLGAPSNPMRTEAINKVEKAIIDRLEKLEATRPVPQMHKRFIYHSTLAGDEARWIKGDFLCREREVHSSTQESNAAKTLSITGTHSGEIERRQYQYLIRGRIVLMNSGELHFAFRGREVGNVNQDDYVATCLIKNETELESGTFCGIWQGMFTCHRKPKTDRTIRFGSGIVVFSHAELATNDLNEFARSYMETLTPPLKKYTLPIVEANSFG